MVIVLWRINRVRYDEIFSTRSAVLRGVTVPIGMGALLLAIATTWLGWWHAVLFEGHRSGPAWVLVVPIIFGAAAVMSLTQIDFGASNARILPTIALAVTIVGFAEEVATRGLLIVGPQESGWPTAAVFVVSTALFALLHGINAFFGQSVRATLTQIGVSFLAGSALYVTRMSTGTLLVCIALHALWDFGMGGTAATNGTAKPSTAVLLIATYAAGLVAAGVVIFT